MDKEKLKQGVEISKEIERLEEPLFDLNYYRDNNTDNKVRINIWPGLKNISPGITLSEEEAASVIEIILESRKAKLERLEKELEEL